MELSTASPGGRRLVDEDAEAESAGSPRPDVPAGACAPASDDGASNLEGDALDAWLWR